MPFKPKEREYRAFGTYNLGESTEDENKLIIRGTPVVFDTPTCLYEYDGIKFFEKIARGAFDSADMSDFIFNLNHELTPYARNKNGSLNYSVGDTFDIEAILDGTDERHRQLYGDIKAGRIDKMSFSFTIAESSYDEETRTRTIIRVKKLYDVSAVTFPAYEQTSISARSFFEAERQKEAEFLENEQRRKKTFAQNLTLKNKKIKKGEITMNEIIQRMNEIRARKAEIRGQLEQRSAEVDLGALETELTALNTEYETLEQRKRLLEGIAGGTVPAGTVENPHARSAEEPVFTRDTVLGTPEYRSAWAKTLMRRALTPTEQRALDVALTTTATEFGAPTADADGVNNGGLFIPTSINLALMEEISLVSPLFRDAARTAIPGLMKFPYKKSSTGADSKKEKDANGDASIEWADLVLGTSEISETIRVSWRLEAMAVDSFIDYIQNELVESVRDKAAQEFIYGDGNEKMKGVAKDATKHSYDGSALDAIGVALGKLGKKQKIGAKIYVSQSIVEEISFSKDKNDNYVFTPINGAGVSSIATYKVEVDPYLNDGDFVIGNVHKYARMNVVESVSLTRDVSGKKRANDYTAYGIFGAATQPGTVVYGKKNA